mmetsp:Transcript_28593/g.71376  ORF Transcript_28593/g.71376 Transcript_28593/m.71376 type:complete len:278 (-) Transcript_28593:251-1084(-)
MQILALFGQHLLDVGCLSEVCRCGPHVHGVILAQPRLLAHLLHPIRNLSSECHGLQAVVRGEVDNDQHRIVSICLQVWVGHNVLGTPLQEELVSLQGVAAHSDLARLFECLQLLVGQLTHGLSNWPELLSEFWSEYLAVCLCGQVNGGGIGGQCQLHCVELVLDVGLQVVNVGDVRGVGVDHADLLDGRLEGHLPFLADLTAELDHGLHARNSGFDVRVDSLLVGLWQTHPMHTRTPVRVAFGQCSGEILIEILGQEWRERGHESCDDHENLVQRAQ